MIILFISAVLQLVKQYFTSWRIMVPVMVAVCVISTGCSLKKEQRHSTVVPLSNVVTADIQEGIEKHIDEQSRMGDGYFELPFDEMILRLKLVRVHVEYLANLGYRRHFACVDLAGTDGNVYDVDFFMEGDPEPMSVTETTVHKINGQPLYTWKQAEDHTWQRVPMDHASNHLLGVIEGSDEFEFIYRVGLCLK
ncbi:MAG: hypothetical protein K9L30_17785 [Desulfobacterales bacterium]|nr:hypothetical protein [Desulfobacterales bacterium]